MAYDKQFYDKYQAYLKEKTVRDSHDFVFDQFWKMTSGQHLRTIDLGCGLGEYHQYNLAFFSDRYVGVDANDFPRDFKYICGDYNDLGSIRKALDLDFRPEVFVSLFSIECCCSPLYKYHLYDRVFMTFPQIKFGLVGGFFYEKARSEETVLETGGITSHQTIEDASLFVSDIFTEFRLHIRTPSQMFGQDVVEVWKFLIRR